MAHLAQIVTNNATLVTPSSGNGINLEWVSIYPPLDVDTVVTLKLGSDNAYIVNAPFAHRAARKGAADAPLTIEMTVPATVIVNADYEEF